jgi:hypothetical protein
MDYWKKNNLIKPQEIIVCAANKYGDTILCGARHHNINTQAYQLGFKKEPNNQGFINQFGEFRNRQEAMIIVKQSGQKFDAKRNGGNGLDLYSEGLY